MTEFNKKCEGDIDLFEVWDVFVDGRRTIYFTTAVAVCFGLIYFYFNPQKYRVSSPYYVEIYSVVDQQFCSSNMTCLENRFSKKIGDISNNIWLLNDKRREAFIVTENVSKIPEYASDLKSLAKNITSKIYIEANEEIQLIQGEPKFLSADSVTKNIINAKRIIRDVDRGRSAIDFGPVSISKSSPRIEHILVLSILLGAMSGALLVLLRNAIRKRRKHAQSDIHGG